MNEYALILRQEKVQYKRQEIKRVPCDQQEELFNEISQTDGSDTISVDDFFAFMESSLPDGEYMTDKDVQDVNAMFKEVNMDEDASTMNREETTCHSKIRARIIYKTLY